MSALGKFLVTVLFVGLIIWMTLANRADVDFSLPFLFENWPVPLALIILGAIVIGFIWGAAIVWFNAASSRSEVRRQRREIKVLEAEITKKEQIV